MELEESSLRELERIVGEARKWRLKLLVIGGYAVRAYTSGYRATKDIDCVISKEETGGLVALLKKLGYVVKETEFGLTGKRKINHQYIDLHISVGEIYDVSTGERYPVNKETFNNAELLEISGHHKETKTKVKAHVISLEELLILKLMTRKRDKDIVDIVALLIDKGNKIRTDNFVKIAQRVNLSRHIRDSLLFLIGQIRTHDARKIWFSITGKILMRKTENELTRKLRNLEEKLH